MKKGITILLLLCIVSISFAQNRFSEGFNAGFREGYCDVRGVGCVPPPPPPPPPLRPGQSATFQDGYNTGFRMGMEAARLRQQQQRQAQQNRVEPNIRGGDFVDGFVYQSPIALIHSAMAARQSLFDTNSELYRILISHIDDIIRNTTDPVLALDMRKQRQLYIDHISMLNWDFSLWNTANIREQFDVISRVVERHNRERTSMTEEARRERVITEHQGIRARMEAEQRQREQAHHEALRRERNDVWGWLVVFALAIGAVFLFK